MEWRTSLDKRCITVFFLREKNRQKGNAQVRRLPPTCFGYSDRSEEMREETKEWKSTPAECFPLPSFFFASRRCSWRVSLFSPLDYSITDDETACYQFLCLTSRTGAIGLAASQPLHYASTRRQARKSREQKFRKTKKIVCTPQPGTTKQLTSHRMLHVCLCGCICSCIVDPFSLFC